MALIKVRNDAASPRRFSAWSLSLWILLLLLAYAGLQYLQHGDFVYLAVSFAAIVVCVGTILRQAWAHGPMRIVLLLLAAYAIASGIVMLLHWGDFEKARQTALANPQFADVLLALNEQAKRVYMIALALKAIALPWLLWLAWALGRPTVAEQFRRSPGRFSAR
jgi:hypothetical protein